MVFDIILNKKTINYVYSSWVIALIAEHVDIDRTLESLVPMAYKIVKKFNIFNINFRTDYGV